jgi:hypothetical protein
VINALLTLLIVLLTGLINNQPPTPYNGRPVAVFTSPVKPHALSRINVIVAAMPSGASHVEIVTDKATFNARHSGVREFTARAVPTPAVPGPWELDVQFTLRGRSFTTPGSVITVTPAR